MRFPAAICSDLRGVNFSLCIGHFCTENANLSKILQDVYSNRSKKWVGLLRAPSPFNYNFAQSNPHIHSIQYQIHSMSYYLFDIC